LPAAIKPFVTLARPSHYLKNGFVFVPLFFAHRLADWRSLTAVFTGFAGFCLAASAVYVFNDIADRKKDAGHPVKRVRPVAAGRVGLFEAWIFCLFLTIMAGVCSLLVFRLSYFFVLLVYMVINLLYSLELQNVPGVNSGCVAAGFVLRVFAGAAVIDVPVSYWLAGLTFLLALFLTFSKRQCEKMSAGGAAIDGRRAFPGAWLVSLAAVCLAGYVGYTLSPGVIREHAAPDLFLTSVWVALGFFRYLQVGFNPAGDCSPVSVFLRDKPLQLIVLSWIGTLWWVMDAAGG